MDEFINEYLDRLGFSKDEISIYISLLKYGAMPLTELSRKSNVERTALYRLIDPLQQKGLIILQIENKRKIIEPADISSIERIISHKQNELNQLKSEKAGFENLVRQIAGQSTDTKVNFYRDTEGIKQVIWNSLAQNKSGVIHTVAHHVLEEIVGYLFFKDWEERFSASKMTNHVVYSDSFKDSVRTTTAKLTDGKLKGVKYYYLKPAIFNISHYFDVYDNTTVYYNWSDEQAYAVEIHNPNIASSNRQLVQLLIKLADKPKAWTEVLTDLGSV